MDIKQKIEIANENAAERLKQGELILVDIAPAGEVIPGLKGKMIIPQDRPLNGSTCAAPREAPSSVR